MNSECRDTFKNNLRTAMGSINKKVGFYYIPRGTRIIIVLEFLEFLYFLSERGALIIHNENYQPRDGDFLKKIFVLYIHMYSIAPDRP